MNPKLSLGVLLLGVLSLTVLATAKPALADDSGDEKVVPVIKWKCTVCGWNAYTFDPDDIAGKTKNDYKLANYQQSNWVMFYDAGRAITKCQKAKDGAHFFEKTGTSNESPSNIRKFYKDIIVLKSGSNMKAKIANVTCAICKKNDFRFFHGDDGDMAVGVKLREPGNVFNMQNGSRIGSCKSWSAGSTYQATRHILHTEKVSDMKSIDLAKSISRLWYSD